MKIINRLTFTCALVLAAFSSNAQIEGDSLFGTDQVVRIDLTFHQTDYWDSLTTNYDNADYMKADLVITDAANNVHNFTDVGIRLKGNSTYNHPNNKKPFKIDFNKYIDDQNYDGLKKLNFSNGFKDPSMMREKVFFDYCKTAEIPAPRANFANVYMNGTLKGFYTVVEQIDDQFLDWNILDDDGNLFKAGDNFDASEDPADLNYYGTDASSYTNRYELKTNEDLNDWTDLIDLVDFIDNSSDADFENNFGTYFNTNEYLRGVAINSLFAHLDSYTGSARNYYLYHNTTTDKWEWIKWDGNETFGSYASGAPGNMENLDIEYHDNDRPLLERVFASDYLTSLYEEQMCYLLQTTFNSSYMDSKIDAIKTLIQADVYADNNKMYTNANFDTNVESNITSGGGPGGGTTYGLKSFISARNSYILGALDCTNLSVNENAQSFEASLFPNPSNSMTTITWNSSDIETIHLFNQTGQEILSNKVTGLNQTNIDVSSLPAGIYFVTLNSNDQQTQLKLVKSK